MSCLQVARGQRRFERGLGIGAILQLIHLPALGGHRAEQRQGLRLQAHLGVGAARRAEEEVVAARGC